jgi:hypothetical protein
MTNYYPSKSKIKYWVRVSIQKIRNPIIHKLRLRGTSDSTDKLAVTAQVNGKAHSQSISTPQSKNISIV